MANKIKIDFSKINGFTADYGSSFTISIGENFVKDSVTNEPNIPIEQTYTLTDAAPQILEYIPADNSTNVNDPVIIIKFNQPILRGNGNIRLTTGVNTVVSEFSVQSSRVSIQNSTDLVIDLSGLIQNNTSYELGSYHLTDITGQYTVISPTTLQTTSIPTSSFGSGLNFTTGNAIITKQFSSNMSSEFSCVVGDKISNSKVSRSFYSNQDNDIFDTNPVQLQYVSSATTYTVTLSCDDGEFGYSTEVPSSSLSITGNPQTVNDILPTIKFYPDLDFESNTTFNLKVFSGGIELESFDIPLNHLGEGSIDEVIIFEENEVYTPEYKFTKYNALADLVVCGGGGGGALGGGAAGQLTYQTGLTNLVSFGSNYNIVIGSGGSAGNGLANSSGGNGGSSSGFGYTSTGGGGGSAATSSINQDPAGGNNASFNGSAGYCGDIYAIPATVSYSSGDVLGGSFVAGSGAGGFGNASSYTLSGPYQFEGTSNDFYTPLCGSFLDPSVRGNTGQPATNTSGFDESPAAGVGRNISFLNQTVCVGGQGVTAYALPRISDPSTRYFIVWQGNYSLTPGSGGAGSLSNDYGSFLKYYKRGNGTPTAGQDGIVAVRFYRS